MAEKQEGNLFIQIVDGSNLPLVSDCTTWSMWPTATPDVSKAIKKEHDYVPVRIDANEDMGIVVVHWNDGTETKVTCDSDDTFSVDAGFAQALKYKIFGGKTEYKEKWLRIIARRVKVHETKPKKVAKKEKKK